MTLHIDENVLIDALDSWGHDEQIGMVHEELGELFTALNQWRRGRITKDKLVTEIADAQIMISQMALMFGKCDVQDQVNYKIERLRQRLLDYNAPKGSGIRKV